MNRKALFPSGAATLSVLSHVPILPVLSMENEGANHVVVFPQMEPDRIDGESKNALVQRLTQKLVDILESALNEYSWQWRYLSALSAYFATEK